MKWTLIACGALSLVGLVFFGALMYVGDTGPEIYVEEGAQLDDDTLAAIREVGALEDGDRVVFFYSDGIFDPREGMYLTTERHVALHVADRDPPTEIFPYATITSARLDRDESFLEDSTIHLELDDGDVWWFPVSSEGDLDVVMYEDLERRIAAVRADNG